MSPYDLEADKLKEYQEHCIIWENEAKSRLTLSIDELFGI